MSMCKYNNLFYFIEKYPTSAQSPGNEIIASNKKFPGLQLVKTGEARFNDLNFYKIVKVKRKVNENGMIRILQFFIPTKNLIKMFKAPTLPPAKKKSCYNQKFDLSLERYENKDLDVLGDLGESKRKICLLPLIY